MLILFNMFLNNFNYIFIVDVILNVKFNLSFFFKV